MWLRTSRSLQQKRVILRIRRAQIKKRPAVIGRVNEFELFRHRQEHGAGLAFELEGTGIVEIDPAFADAILFRFARIGFRRRKRWQESADSFLRQAPIESKL